MRSVLLRLEWRLLWTQRAFWLSAALFLLLSALSVAVGHNSSTARDANARGVQEEETRLRKRLASAADDPAKSEKWWEDPSSAAGVSWQLQPRAVLPPSALSALAVGQSDVYPQTAKVSIHGWHALASFGSLDHPLHLATGSFDMAFVVLYLLPLLTLGTSFDLISREREAGTLALLLAQPLALGRLVLRRVWVRWCVVWLLCLVVGMTGALADGAQALVTARFLMWAAVTAAYCALWFAVAMAANAFGKSSEANALTLLGLWVAVTILIPAGLQGVASAVWPLPSRVALVGKVRAASEDASRRGAELLVKYQGDHPELAGNQQADDFARWYQAVQDEVEKQVTPTLDQFDRQLKKQQAALSVWRLLSPVAALQEALLDLSGVGLARQVAFLDQVRAFQSKWKEELAPRVFAGARMTGEDHRSLPVFQFSEEPASAVLWRSCITLLALLLPTLLLAFWALVRLQRYPLREEETQMRPSRLGPQASPVT